MDTQGGAGGWGMQEPQRGRQTAGNDKGGVRRWERILGDIYIEVPSKQYASWLIVKTCPNRNILKSEVVSI